MKKTESPFYLLALCQVLGLILQGRTVSFTAREGIAAAFLLALVQGVLLAVLRGLPRSRLWPEWEAFCGILLTALFLAVGGSQIVRMSMLCRRAFQAGGMWVLLLAACLCLLPANWHALCRMQQALWLPAILTGGLLLGLFQQLDWRNLAFAPVDSGRLWQAMGFMWLFSPELLALPWIPDVPRGFFWKLPLGVALLESGLLFVAEALFGWEADVGRAPVWEGFRCSQVGPILRLENLLVWLWLLLSLYRLLVLWQLLRRVKPGGAAHEIS